MSFIGDRYEIMASWILNPRQMWRGRDLEQYLQDIEGGLPPPPATPYLYYGRRQSTDKNLEQIENSEEITTTLQALTSPSIPSLWAGVMNLGMEPFTRLNAYPLFNTFSSSSSKRKKFYRNPYTSSLIDALETSDKWPTMSNTISLSNRELAAFIDNNLNQPPVWKANYPLRGLQNWSSVSRRGKSYRASLNTNSVAAFLVTSLPNFLLARTEIKSLFDDPDDVSLPQDANEIGPKFEAGVELIEQDMFYHLLSKTFVNPSWLKVTGWTELMSSSETTSCQYCDNSTLYCMECEEGYSECSECGGSYTWSCEECDDGWVECSTCDGTETVDCEACEGSGQEDCTMCDNEGTNDCEECNGTAILTECPFCEGTGWEGGSANEAQDNECEECAGEGETSPYDCPSCEEGQVECEYGCDGEGQVDCEACDGDGETTCTSCDGEGGSSCEAYGCYDGTIYCEYCEEGYNQCGECGGDYDWGSCTYCTYTELSGGESVETGLTKLQPRIWDKLQRQRGLIQLNPPRTRRSLLKSLLARKQSFNLPDGEFDLMKEVYGDDIKFEMLTVREIWKRFLNVMKNNERRTNYFFCPKEHGVDLLVTTNYHLDDSIFSLATLGFHVMNAMPRFTWSGDTDVLAGTYGGLSNNRYLSIKTYTGGIFDNEEQFPFKVSASEFEAGAEFRAKFGISIQPRLQGNPMTLEEASWNIFWREYKATLQSIASKSGSLIQNFKFLFGSSRSDSFIRALNYPKG